MLKATSRSSVSSLCTDLLVLGAAGLQPELPDHAAAAGGHHLVHHPHHAAVDRPVLRRAALRPGQQATRRPRACPAIDPTQSACSRTHAQRPGRACHDRRTRGRPTAGAHPRPAQELRHGNLVLDGIDLDVHPRRASRCCSARPVRASRRCCDASTTWRGRTRASSNWPGRSWATAPTAPRTRTGCTSCAPVEDHPLSAPGHRHGVPAVQPVPASHRAGEHRPRAPWSAGEAGAEEGREAARAAQELLARVGLAGRDEVLPAASCPVVSSSGWRSPGRWRCDPQLSCCSTNRPVRWIRNWSAKCLRSMKEVLLSTGMTHDRGDP